MSYQFTLVNTMNDLTWIGWIFGVFSVILLGLLLHLKKTDRAIGCEKYRKHGCHKIEGYDCDFPNCDTLNKYRISEKS